MYLKVFNGYGKKRVNLDGYALAIKRQLSLAWLVGIVVGGIAFIVCEISALFLLGRYNRDSQAMRDQYTAWAGNELEAFFSTQLQGLERDALAYGAWDQFAEYLDNRENEEWFKRNVFPAVIQGGLRNSVESILILDKALEVVVSYKPAVSLRVTENVARHPFVKDALAGKLSSGYVFSDGKLLKMAASPVTPTFDRSSISGVYLIAAEVTTDLLARSLGREDTGFVISFPELETGATWQGTWLANSSIRLPTFDSAISKLQAPGQGVVFTEKEVAVPYTIRDHQNRTIALAWLISQLPVRQALFSYLREYSAYALLISLIVSLYAAVAMRAVLGKPMRRLALRMGVFPGTEPLQHSVIGELESLIAAAEDQDMRLKREQHLRRGVISACEVGVMTFDKDKNVSEVNGYLSRLTGYAAKKFIDASDPFFFLDEQSREVCQQFIEMLNSDQAMDKLALDAKALSIDGASKDVRLSFRAINYETEQHLILVVSERSNDQVIEAGRNKAERTRVLGQFAAGVAHNMNNLLTSILGSASLLSQSIREIDAESKETLLTSIRRAASEGAGLTKSLQQLSQVNEGRNYRRPVDVLKVIRDVISVATSMEAARRCEFILRLPEQSAMALTEEAGLHQVLLNLLLNSVDAMPSGGAVIVAVREVKLEGEYVVIEVQDDGCGISEELQGRIFEPFFTTKKGKKNGKTLGGSGLGLSSALALVESWGGGIECESIIGLGTKFSIRLHGVGEAHTLTLQ